MYLLITIHFHEGRFHGRGDWPPSPARLFQALIAGIGLEGPLEDKTKETFKWLENLNAPIIGAPLKTDGQRVKFYVPRNTIDAMGGDQRSILREKKYVEPRLFNASTPFIYAWPFEKNEVNMRQGNEICEITKKLYQFGCGIDMAWAQAEILEDNALHERLLEYPGRIYRPTIGGGAGINLICPSKGSIDSLDNRYKANIMRFQFDGSRQILSQPTKVHFTQITYDSPPIRCLYELRKAADSRQFSPIPLNHSATLVLNLRNAANQKLLSAFPRQEQIVRSALDSKAHYNNQGIKNNNQINLIPLPSIGHHYADCDVRRVLIEVPPNCQLHAEDVFWAFSGLTSEGSNVNGGEETILIRIRGSENLNMLSHYGIIDKSEFKIWRTVTPAALPEKAKRRRIDPTRTHEDAKSGSERASEEMRAAVAILHELRNERMLPQIESIHVQREPFQSRGMRAEAFSEGTPFVKEQLWHIEVAFKESIDGPLMIGDGRFLGLGVMAPVRNA